MSTLGRFVPGLAALGSYERSWLTPDLVAGVTVWAILVPQGLGYASLAGLPTVLGLYAALGGLLLYWLWGSSRELNVGPESTVAIMVATILAPMAAAGSAEYASLAATLAILVGLVLLFGGLLKLGWIADLLSRPVLAGYVFGSGLLIIGSQLVGLFGLEGVDKSLYAFDIGAVIRNLGETNVTALAIGVGSIVLVLGLRRVNRKIPGALIVVVGSILLVALLGLDDRVEVVGSFPSGVPMPSLPAVGLESVLMLIGPAFAVALLVYPDSVLTARSLSILNKYQLEPNREFFGIGAGNIGAGFMGGFPVNGSQSRSFVALSAGAKSQVSNLWASAFVVLTLVLQRAAAPSTAILGRMPGTDTYRDVADHPEADLTPGLLVYRFDAPVFFANAGRLRDEILADVDAADPAVTCVVLDAESIYDIDSTGAQTLLELLDSLDEQGIRLVLARVRTELRDELLASGIEARIGAEHFYLEIDDAVTANRPAATEATTEVTDQG